VRVEGWPPLWLTPVPAADVRRGDGAHCAEFIESLCKVTKDSVAGAAGSLIVLRGWQRALLGHLLARRPDGRYRHRQALIGVARKNGKSALGAGLALYGLLCGPDGGEVYSCAGEKEQARIVFGTARRMVEMEPELADVCKLYRDAIEIPSTGSVYRALSAEAYSKEGLNPHKVIFDEVHVQPNRELWDVMALASGARVEPLMVGITTAGVRVDSTGQDSLCYGMYGYGKQVATGEVDDPSFFMAWWEPRDPSADHRDPDTWREANPGYGDLVSAEDFASSVLRTPEAEYRTKRANQWVSRATAWLPVGTWAGCVEDRPIPNLAEVVLGFDGSFSNDSTALVAVQVGECPHVDVVECWERPRDAGHSWRVPVEAVEDAIRTACRRWQVREIVCDPFRWARTYQVLEGEGLPVVEFPQSPQRMVPATQRFYEAVLNDGLTHSGDPRLARHIDNCVIKTDQRGPRLMKDAKNSPRKIDLAVAAVMAFWRACAPVEDESVEPWAAWV
jgi:phage terminase large subunit-like protein